MEIEDLCILHGSIQLSRETGGCYSKIILIFMDWERSYPGPGVQYSTQLCRKVINGNKKAQEQGRYQKIAETLCFGSLVVAKFNEWSFLRKLNFAESTFFLHFSPLQGVLAKIKELILIQL